MSSINNFATLQYKIVIGFSLILLILSLVGCSGENVDSPYYQVIKDRQANFRKMREAFKSIEDELSLRFPDFNKLRESALSIRDVSEELPTWFPEGSGKNSGVDTLAEDSIWEDQDEFRRIFREDYLVELDRLIDVMAFQNVSAAQSQFHSTGTSCSNCHTKFKEDD